MNSDHIPKVSIISASYNHEKYIDRFIRSILNQVFDDFELIIVDDFSQDNNLKVAQSFKDPRIKIIKHNFNQGPSAAFNDGIKNSKGDYLAFLASDDEVYPNYLKEGIEFLETNKQYNALCFQLEGIDENSKKLSDNKFQSILKFQNLKYYQLIRGMFVRGNMLPAPGEIVRRSIVREVGLFNPALFQIQDYEFHVRTLLKNQIFVYPKPLVKYRQGINTNHIDNHNLTSQLRQSIELSFVLDRFLEIELEMFKKVFEEDYKKIGEPFKKTIPYFLGMIAINTGEEVRQRWGYQIILKFIENIDNLKLINSLYFIEYKDIVALSSKIRFFSKQNNKSIGIYKVKEVVGKIIGKFK